MPGATPLVPVGVRIAAREAMVALYLGQIDDLFQIHGFVDRDHSLVGQGQRRTRADQYHARIDFASLEQARRYLELLGDLLDFEPPGGQSRLRRTLERAGLVGPDGRLRLAIDQPPQPTDEDVAGMWGLDRIRVFFSHVHAVRAEVSAIANAMERIHCSCFVAHTQIESGRDWQDVIEDALRTCHVLVAYVTDGFPASNWTDQEVGWALGRGIPMIPVNAGAVPVEVLKAEQERITTGIEQATRILDRTDGHFQQAEDTIRKCMDLLGDCQRAYRRAGDSVRRQFNQAFFDRIFVDVGGITGTELRPEFARLLAFDVARRFEREDAGLSLSGVGSNNGPLVDQRGRKWNRTFRAAVVGVHSRALSMPWDPARKSQGVRSVHRIGSTPLRSCGDETTRPKTAPGPGPSQSTRRGPSSTP
jgi:hypothetical protein